MLEELLGALGNYFETDRVRGTFEVAGGHLEVPGLQVGQYVRVVGSTFNDGLWRAPVRGMSDETFTGEVWPLAVPRAVLALAEEVERWVASHPEPDYVSESFGGYSYSRPTSQSGGPVRWRDAFAADLRRWRKL